MNSLKYFGLAIASAGMSVPPDDSYDVVAKQIDHTNKKVVLKDGLIMGMVFCGDVDKSGLVFGLMRDRINVDEFKEGLVEDDFSLASLPEIIWRERLGVVPAGFAATKMEEVEEEVGGD